MLSSAGFLVSGFLVSGFLVSGFWFLVPGYWFQNLFILTFPLAHLLFIFLLQPCPPNPVFQPLNLEP